ncbi:sperm acrosome membrane-associated protein 6 isoform X1 [Herpailurus yagouaroundi]|uniref:sperm acrosome membrane-associated protein 6 isoform X1 n=2 Tax=Herpailurus yagouaroundi TaxID=1608482 RepID=UPI001AD7E342|nr:sperm acrosome membrane-associated protein 6 isoform X1 [Puma yagouaroundi]XP_040314037.1 sperm acrosome membrane-associated protein 6 isoform X1 [Puma yagouaroundi]
MAPLAQDSAVLCALVALTVFRAPAWACLICFTSYKERTRICQIFAGIQGPELEKCQEAFSSAFADLADIEINYDDRSHLHDAFTQMTHSLQEIAAAQGSFNVAFPDAAEKMRKVVMKLKGAQACVPPCGFQDVARRFLCYGCYSKACNFPLDCPGERRGLEGEETDLTVTRGQQAKFSCTVNFQLPKEEITYSWKFAGGGLRTQDQSYFRDIPRAQGYLARIRPVQPTHSGTFSCSILHDQRPVARLYFFLNVTSAPPRGEIELQVSFRKVLRWAPKETETLEPWRPSLGELLARPEALTPGNQCLLAALAAVASASATLTVWVFFRWYFKGN